MGVGKWGRAVLCLFSYLVGSEKPVPSIYLARNEGSIGGESHESRRPEIATWTRDSNDVPPASCQRNKRNRVI